MAFSSWLHKLRLRANLWGNCTQFTCRLHLFEKNGLSFWKPASRTNISSWCEESWIGLSSRADFNLFPQLHSWASQSQTDRLRPPPLLTPKVQQWQITVIRLQPQASPWCCSNHAKIWNDLTENVAARNVDPVILANKCFRGNHFQSRAGTFPSHQCNDIVANFSPSRQKWTYVAHKAEALPANSHLLVACGPKRVSNLPELTQS